MSNFVQQHQFLGAGHKQSEARTWRVVWLCAAMMVIEIGGGFWFGSIALVADGLHMSTHAGALLLAALAYSLASKHADDPRFSFGTGKFGDLAGFTSAIILALIALLVAYEALSRLFTPKAIDFSAAIPIACLGLVVNIASAWLLSGGGEGGHEHSHAHGHGHDHGHDHSHGAETGRDNNMRAALVHVVADAAVSVLVIIGLVLAKIFGWLWLDPVVGLVGAAVIANWALGLVRDTGAILLDMTPDPDMARKLRDAVVEEGDELADFHLWRLGPGHLGAIVSIATASGRDAAYYRAKLGDFTGVSHLTVEVHQG